MDLVILNHGQVTRTTPERAPPSPNYHTNRRTFELSADLICITPLHQWYWAQTHDMPATSLLPRPLDYRGHPPTHNKNTLSSQLASLDKNNALQEIKLRLSYLQGKSTTMSVIAHQTEKEWISANEKSRQRMSQTQAEGAAKQHAARLEEAHLRAHHSCFTSERS
ncbi:hypothetical protein TNCV_3601541 [Trichonephila clavipes]|nr:hypothetical protein TNCV_3601541 [Trichonephila clavipes]